MFSHPMAIGDAVVYSAAAEAGCLADPPWGDAKFDCFLINCTKAIPSLLGRRIALELVSAKTEWIETFGPMAELFHDWIDSASVEIGRQSHVGDGSPMTAWHEDITNIDALADYIRTGGLGSETVKAMLVFGDILELRQVERAIRDS